ncbi:hypothetical protein ONV78_30495 [Hahella sp. CR1]|uniref:hypothetical protein n=1 Tax=Hahella sp. CR1 TaxID=2992807 RepID=UPI002441A8F8|nr:hypothetical protein [Hahella sp. CR1]MDG9672102.1 hypothetical protein [Hahella sp. CR1]
MEKEILLNNGMKLTLSKKAINHITNGVIVESINNVNGKRVARKAIKGGLHSYQGWIDFKSNYKTKIEHLRFFDSATNSFWYFSRELSNGVITLRIPRELFTKNSAKLTMYPDEYYKSGYLWKTLFPKNFSENDIVKAIESSLLNIDEDQCQVGQIVGYYNINSPRDTIRITIQHTGSEIQSAFPSWTQPNIDNNGKPYSHFENIGFVLAESTEYFDDFIKINNKLRFNIGGDKLTIRNIIKNTPNFFKLRGKPNLSSPDWTYQRNEEIKLLSKTISKEDVESIVTYLSEFVMLKEYPCIMSNAYCCCYNAITSNIRYYNSFMIPQNIIDGVKLLYYHGDKCRFLEVIENIFKNMASFTMFDLVSKKRILSTILMLVSDSNDSKMIYKFITFLSVSPIRRELYTEYNLNSIKSKKRKLPIYNLLDLAVINNPSIRAELNVNDYIEILKESVGESYTLNFSDEYLDDYLSRQLAQMENNYKSLISHSLMHCDKDEFLSLSDHIGKLLANLKSPYKDNSLLTAIELIMRDYARIQFAQRLRINARYKEYHDFTNVVYCPVDKNLLYGTILKHERILNRLRLETFFDDVKKYLLSVNSKKQLETLEKLKAKIGKEVPPLPLKIPAKLFIKNK